MNIRLLPRTGADAPGAVVALCDIGIDEPSARSLLAHKHGNISDELEETISDILAEKGYDVLLDSEFAYGNERLESLVLELFRQEKYNSLRDIIDILANIPSR